MNQTPDSFNMEAREQAPTLAKVCVPTDETIVLRVGDPIAEVFMSDSQSNLTPLADYLAKQ